MMLGIDIGTQSLKAVILTPEFAVLGEGAVAYQPTFPQAGWAEQDPLLWERALKPAIGAALAAARLSPQDIASIGIAGQLDGVVAVDDAGNPVHPCIIWMDRRAETEIADIDADLVLRRCGVILDASHPAAKIRWLKKHVRARRFHVPVSHVVSRLVGSNVIDHATASTTMVYGLAARDYDAELLFDFGIERDQLPEPRAADSLAGELTRRGSELTGLPAGLPVAVGTADDFASTLGAGIAAPGRFINVLGTAEVAGAPCAELLIDAQRLVETHAFTGGHYFIENPGWLSGGAITWFCNTFGVAGAQAFDKLAATAPPGCDGVTFIPALAGAMAPRWIASARASFTGLNASHGSQHMARAVLEGTAFAMKDVLDRVLAMGVPVEALRIVGGGAKSQLWTQIRADLTGLPAEVPQHLDTSAIGAALLGGWAAGRVADIIGAAQKIAAPLAVVLPSAANMAACNMAYQRYRSVFDHLHAAKTKT